jgi:hypothetical protein
VRSSTLKGLDDAAVDKDSGRIGRRGLCRSDKIVCAIVDQPQSCRTSSDQFKSVSLERLGWPYGHFLQA